MRGVFLIIIAGLVYKLFEFIYLMTEERTDDDAEIDIEIPVKIKEMPFHEKRYQTIFGIKQTMERWVINEDDDGLSWEIKHSQTANHQYNGNLLAINAQRKANKSQANQQQINNELTTTVGKQ